jgi:glycosyltransferase involved in cell wall biosynthesis
MSDLPKVAVCFASGDMVHADFALALAGLCAAAHPIETSIINAKSSIVAEARNRCVELARENGADFLLFLDSDMVFPRTALQQLLAHKKDIVGATYPKRVAPHSVLGAALTDGRVEDDGALIEMRHMPTGCLLIDMKVFDAVAAPNFRFLVDPQTGAIIGEDYDFCDRARAAGFSVWCDSRLSFEIGHIGQSVHRLSSLKVE